MMDWRLMKNVHSLNDTNSPRTILSVEVKSLENLTNQSDSDEKERYIGDIILEGIHSHYSKNDKLENEKLQYHTSIRWHRQQWDRGTE